ncbi:MAG: bifunctional nuclease family protein [Candidatus Tectomicrobia bacterium]|uniref:Bifunctional nuclease family protein n=1 Tax=Tectimicrobiota bacterium TaxID=2528274 RepID=A0A938B5E0_UNCTE|nr:bifunctional nuclease family protein [Candidatus Tectomicrobia bacterium]
MQKMKIGTVLFDQAKGAAVVTLVEEQGERVLPIFIGMWEGMALFRELNRTPSPRPVLHDIVYHLFEGFHARLEKVVVDTVQDNTYFAQVYVALQESTMIADARPSDALALALRFQAPIYVAEAVLAASGKRGDFAAGDERREAAEADQEKGEDLHAWLENLRPEDFADPH